MLYATHTRTVKIQQPIYQGFQRWLRLEREHDRVSLADGVLCLKEGQALFSIHEHDNVAFIGVRGEHAPWFIGMPWEYGYGSAVGHVTLVSQPFAAGKMEAGPLALRFKAHNPFIAARLAADDQALLHRVEVSAVGALIAHSQTPILTLNFSASDPGGIRFPIRKKI